MRTGVALISESLWKETKHNSQMRLVKRQILKCSPTFSVEAESTLQPYSTIQPLNVSSFGFALSARERRACRVQCGLAYRGMMRLECLCRLASESVFRKLIYARFQQSSHLHLADLANPLRFCASLHRSWSQPADNFQSRLSELKRDLTFQPSNPETKRARERERVRERGAMKEVKVLIFPRRAAEVELCN